MIRFGGPVFVGQKKAAGAGESHGSSVDDVFFLARKHKEKGYRAAYAPTVRIKDKERIRDIRKAFESENITIAEVGYWQNLLHTDVEMAGKHRDAMQESLAVADELNACCAVDILGSYVSEGGIYHNHRNFSANAFDAAVEMARFFIDSVKPKHTFFTYEMFPFNVADSPEALRKLIDAVDRKQFGVHMDLVNLINCPRAYYSSGNIMHRCIQLFGDRIVSAHAKDILMETPAISVILREVLPGRGNLDYRTYLRELHQLPQAVPLMMDHLSSEEEYDLATAHIRSVADKEDISL